MILDYNRKPDATVDEKVQSLMESTQLALNDIARAQDTADVAKEDAQTSIALSQTARQAANEASESAARAKEAADEAAEAVEEIEGDVSGLKTRVTQAEADIDAAESDISALGTRVGTAEGKITTIEGDVTLLEGSVTSLSGRVAQAESDIDAVEGDITTLQGDVSTAKGDITTIQGDITNLSGRVSAAEGDITAVEGDITSLQGRVSDAEDDVEDVMKGLALAEDVVGTLTWITAHSTVTTDTTPQQGTVYYIKHLDGTFEAVTDTTGKNPAQEGWYVLDEALQNYVLNHLVLTDEGLWLIPEKNATVLTSSKKVLLATGGTGHTYEEAGTYIIEKVDGGDEVIAKFTANESVVGNDSKAHSSITEDGMKIFSIDSNSNLVELAHIGYGQTSNGIAPYFTFGSRLSNAPIHDSETYYYIGDVCKYRGSLYVCNTDNTHGDFDYSKWYSDIGKNSFAEGLDTIATNENSHAEGYASKACGFYSHAEGEYTVAYGTASHAEGYASKVYGFAAHADGYGAKALGTAAHAEGNNSVASGVASHAEGQDTVASGVASHAQNYDTIAQRRSQTALGEYNISDTQGADETVRGKYVVIIGNGTSNSNRSNALTVAWNGDVEASGDITDGNGNVLDDKADSSDLADYLPLVGGTLTGTLFGTRISVSGNLEGENALLQLDTTAQSGVDKEIYDALVNLGWDSDVIV